LTSPTIKVPPTLAILAVILVLAALAAEFLPAGSFERVEKTIRRDGTRKVVYTVKEGDTIESIAAALLLYPEDVAAIRDKSTGAPLAGPVLPGMELELTAPNTGTRRVVVPGSYKRVERPGHDTPLAVGTSVVGAIFTAPIRGFMDKGDVIAFILIVGGAFGIILGTGAVDRFLHYAVQKLGSGAGRRLVIPALMILFSFGGATFGMSEEVIPFVLITIPLALRLGYDTITGLCMSFVAAGLGFASAFFNPFTVQVAQGIAELKPLSGIGFRVGVWVAATAIGIVYTMWWAGRVLRRPELSPTYENDRAVIAGLSTTDSAGPATLGLRDIGVLLSLGAAIIVIMWGVIEKGWYMNELTGCFIAAGVAAAVFGGMRVGRVCETFVRGASDLTGAALIVAFSSGIVLVLRDGQVLDTILNSIAGALEGTHAGVGACLMYTFQTLLNVLVPSGSGQAAMTMPIMAPLADAMGISRQVAVLAFQFGDGFGNMIIPTSAVTMSVLGIAQISWTKWAKWILPLEAILFAFGCVALVLAVAIGYQ
jgi:uncharacterized ion transporter superfamily protein YfcC